MADSVLIFEGPACQGGRLPTATAPGGQSTPRVPRGELLTTTPSPPHFDPFGFPIPRSVESRVQCVQENRVPWVRRPTIGGPHDPTAIKDLFAKKMCDPRTPTVLLRHSFEARGGARDGYPRDATLTSLTPPRPHSRILIIPGVRCNGIESVGSPPPPPSLSIPHPRPAPDTRPFSFNHEIFG